MGIWDSREESVCGDHVQELNSPLAFAVSWALGSGFHRADAGPPRSLLKCNFHFLAACQMDPGDN